MSYYDILRSAYCCCFEQTLIIFDCFYKIWFSEGTKTVGDRSGLRMYEFKSAGN